MDRRELAQHIINAMLAEIKKHGLELLRRYPGDLLESDRQVLETMAVPGTLLAWVVGNSHSHLFPMGLHPVDNETVNGMTKLSADDRYYRLDVQEGGFFRLREVGSHAFLALSGTPIPYSMDRGGKEDAFWLRHERTGRVGFIKIQRFGAGPNARHHADITAVSGCKPIDCAALQVWALRCCANLAGSLLAPMGVHWNNPVSLAA